MPTTVKTYATGYLAMPRTCVILALRKIAPANLAFRNENEEEPLVQIIMTLSIYVKNVPHTASCNVKGADDQPPSRSRRGSQDADGFGQLRQFLVFASS
jgi:hypothetical protein